jgi:phosphatidate cytidylyltransferase
LNTLVTRALTGVIFVAVMVAGIYISPYTLAALFLLINALSLHEYLILVAAFDPDKRPETQQSLFFLHLIGFAIFALLASVGLNWLDMPYLWLIVPLLLLVFLKELYNAVSAQPFVRSALHITGFVYICIPLGMTLLLANPNGQFAPNRIMGILILVWANDTFAYLAGFTAGRTPLFKRISPKKTWEGSVGGAAGTLLAAYLLSTIMPDFSLTIWLCIGILSILFGTWGDLVESMLKRNTQIKDSGSILPGHGGILDRFDAYYFVIPFIMALLYAFNH